MSNVTPAGLFPEIPQLDSLNRILSVLSSEGLWKRVGVIVIGTALVIFGAVILVSGTRAAKETVALVKGVASKVVTKGVV